MATERAEGLVSAAEAALADGGGQDNGSAGTMEAAAAIACADADLAARRVAAEEEDAPHEMKKMLAAVARDQTALVQIKARFSLLSRQRAAQAARRHDQERSRLLSKSAAAAGGAEGGGSEGSSEGDNARRALLDQASMLDKSRDVAASLRRTMQLVGQELDRMNTAEQVLAQDNETIRSTVDQYGSYKTAADKSSAVLKEIQRQEKIDYLVVAACFSFFLMVVAFIVYKRTIGWIF